MTAPLDSDQPHRNSQQGRGPLTQLNDMSLRTKFALIFALAATIVIALVGSLAYNAAATLIRSNTKQEFSSTVAGLDHDLSAPTLGPSTVSGLSLLDSETFTFRVLGTDGTVGGPARDREEIQALPITPTDREIARTHQPGVVETRGESVDGDQYRIATLSLGSARGAVQIVQRLSPTERLLDTLAWQIVLVGGAACVGAGLTGALLARRITSRLIRLTEASEYVSSTGQLDLVAPDDEQGGRDEVGRLGKAFNEMLARLASAKEEQRRLVQNASHELRTPLTSLRTNVSVMKRFDQLSPQGRERLVEDMQGETRELTELVNELVELATDSREDEPQQQVTLREIAERVAARASRRSGREVVVDADDTVVLGRPHALERALSNPVENAVKFDEEGRQPVEIVVRSGRVEVRDRGPGIGAEELTHIFERFYRSTSARSLPGSGLGLSMVRDIVTAHNGEVFAYNREDGGMVVGFELAPVSPTGPAASGADGGEPNG
ncbi:sensor histidine kinase [Salinactinospora qingdaonensis]|uniref:histidine kinase n=1 Tax=Salinactinospora qingdaonensis TaxID=702744 RepID=A0ABP7FZ12_9ACTN